MDWTTLFKDYPLLIPALATVLVAILGYFFVRWNSTHNTNLEFQKKEYDRRAVIHDKNLQDARKYVDTLNTELLSFRRFFEILLDDPKAFHDNYDDFMEESANLPEQIKEFTLNSSIIRIINDTKLRELDLELSKLMIPIMENFLELWHRMITEDKLDLRSVEKEKLIFPDEVDDLITEMKIRLDELAKKVPK